MTTPKPAFKVGDKVRGLYFRGVVTKATVTAITLEVTEGEHGWVDMIGKPLEATRRGNGLFCRKGCPTKPGYSIDYVAGEP